MAAGWVIRGSNLDTGSVSLPQNVQTGLRAQADPLSGVKLTSHLHLLRMSGAILLFLPYALMVWTGPTLPVYTANNAVSNPHLQFSGKQMLAVLGKCK